MQISAISSPLLEVGIERATGIVWNITGGSDLTLFEVNQAAEIIYDLVDPEVRFCKIQLERNDLTLACTSMKMMQCSLHEGTCHVGFQKFNNSLGTHYQVHLLRTIPVTVSAD